MNTEELIHTICEKDCRVRPICTWRCGLGWVGFTGLFIYGMLSLCGCREDIFAMLDTPAFRVEIYAAFATGFIAALSASWLSIPDCKQQRWEYWLVLAPLLVFVSALIYEAFYPNTGTVPPFQGYMQMYMHMIAYTIVPGLLLFALLKRAATTRLCWISVMAGISIFCLSHVGIRLGNVITGMDDVLLKVIVPNLLITTAISLVGYRMLRW